jgi:hypothetical protein
MLPPGYEQVTKAAERLILSRDRWINQGLAPAAMNRNPKALSWGSPWQETGLSTISMRFRDVIQEFGKSEAT